MVRLCFKICGIEYRDNGDEYLAIKSDLSFDINKIVVLSTNSQPNLYI